MPGLSRSGLTVSALLARQIDRREALVLSFLMSVPASLGAGIFSTQEGGSIEASSALIAMIVAAVVGLLTIRILLAVVERVNFAKFVIIVGAFINRWRCLAGLRLAFLSAGSFNVPSFSPIFVRPDSGSLD